MNVYSIPTTGAQIMADTLADTALDWSELAASIAAGTPKIRVQVTSDGYGNLRAHIIAGVEMFGEHTGFIYAFGNGQIEIFAPRVEWKGRDGRETPAALAKRSLRKFFAMEDATVIEWISLRD